ncbi:MAG: anti-sigma factor [Dehalococcoidia bacterium]
MGHRRRREPREAHRIALEGRRAMTPDEREELLAAYALGTLSGPEAREIEDLVRIDPRAAADLAVYHEMVDMIALSVPLRHADPRLRDRVMDAARRESRRQRERPSLRRWIPVGAAAAAVLVAAIWGFELRGDIQALERQNRALTAVVEADAKRIDAIAGDALGGEPDALRLQLESALADQQLTLAVTADPDAVSSVLQPTPSGHGAGGRYLWSEDLGAGVVVVRSLPALPIGSVYEVWLEDGTFATPAGTFVPDENGAAEVVVRPSEPVDPGRILIAVAPTGGSAAVGRPIVLVGLVGR